MTTTTPHKHVDLIKAWADGAEIEFYSVVTNEWEQDRLLAWFSNYEYRVKAKIVTKIEQDRVEFERLAKEEFEPPHSFERDDDNYFDGYLDSAWWGFKTARNQELVLPVCESQFELLGYMDDFGNFETTLKQWMVEEPNTEWQPVFKKTTKVEAVITKSEFTERGL